MSPTKEIELADFKVETFPLLLNNKNKLQILSNLLVVLFFITGIIVSSLSENKNTWIVSIPVGGLCVFLYFVSKSYFSVKTRAYVFSIILSLFILQLSYQVNYDKFVHFLFFIAVLVLSFYKEWKAILLTTFIVSVQYIVLLFLFDTNIYTSDAVQNKWLGAGIHFSLLFIQSFLASSFADWLNHTTQTQEILNKKCLQFEKIDKQQKETLKQNIDLIENLESKLNEHIDTRKKISDELSTINSERDSFKSLNKNLTLKFTELEKEKKLVDSYLSVLMKAPNTIVLITNKKGKVISAEGITEKALGKRKEKVIGSNILSIIDDQLKRKFGISQSNLEQSEERSFNTFKEKLIPTEKGQPINISLKNDENKYVHANIYYEIIITDNNVTNLTHLFVLSNIDISSNKNNKGKEGLMNYDVLFNKYNINQLMENIPVGILKYKLNKDKNSYQIVNKNAEELLNTPIRSSVDFHQYIDEKRFLDFTKEDINVVDKKEVSSGIIEITKNKSAHHKLNYVKIPVEEVNQQHSIVMMILNKQGGSFQGIESTISQLPSPFVITNNSFQFIKANDALITLLEYQNPSELDKISLIQILFDKSILPQMYNDLKTSETIQPIQTKIIRKDQTVFWASLNISKIIIEQKEYFIIGIQSKQKLKNMESRSILAEDITNSVLKMTGCSVCELDVRIKRFTLDQAFNQWTNQNEDLKYIKYNQFLDQFIHPDSKGAINNAIEKMNNPDDVDAIDTINIKMMEGESFKTKRAELKPIYDASQKLTKCLFLIHLNPSN